MIQQRRRQTRRSVSFRAEVHERMRRRCEAQGVAVAAWLEQIVVRELDATETPSVSREEALAAQCQSTKDQ